MRMRDELLVERLKRSPEQGMKQLIDKYGGTVRALVKGRLMPQSFSEADIDECTADTFSDFYLSLDRCDLSKGSVKAYLCVIARNKAADRLRSYYRNLSVVPLEENDAVFELDLEDKEMRARLIEAVKELPTPDREIIIRKFFYLQSSREIADALDMSVSNVDTRTHRALGKLRVSLGGEFK